MEFADQRKKKKKHGHHNRFDSFRLLKQKKINTHSNHIRTVCVTYLYDSLSTNSVDDQTNGDEFTGLKTV